MKLTKLHETSTVRTAVYGSYAIQVYRKLTVWHNGRVVHKYKYIAVDLYQVTMDTGFFLHIDAVTFQFGRITETSPRAATT